MAENTPNTRENSTKKRRTLRWSLLVLVFLCWVLPVMFTVGVSGVNSARSARSRVADVMEISIQNVMDNLQRDLDVAVNSALSLSYTNTFRDAYAEYLETKNLMNLYNDSKSFLTQQYSRSNIVLAAYLIYPEVPSSTYNRCYAYNPTLINAVQATGFYSSSAYTRAIEMMPQLGTKIGFLKDDGKLYLVRNLSLLGNSYVPYAMLVTEINEEYLYRSVKNLPWLTEVTIFLNGVELNVSGQMDIKNEFTEENSKKQRDILFMQGQSAGERYTLDYYVKADLQPLMAEMRSPVSSVFLVALLSAVLMVFVFYFFIKKVDKPITLLSTLAGQIEQGEFGAQTDADELGSREFFYLGTQMNAMSARLNDQFERIYREELALRDAKMMALQSQINPHFLGNTLEIINWEARLAGNVKVSRMMEALSTMLDATLDRRSRPFVHLSEEMMYVDAYLYIIKERLGKRLELEKDIEPELMNWYVPRLVLQPILENAIEHGVSSRPQGKIVLRAREVKEDGAEGWMLFEVINNTPMSAEDEKRVEELLNSDDDNSPPGERSVSIGIRNVNQRLRILYGPKGGINVENDGSGNTVSSIRIQYRELP